MCCISATSFCMENDPNKTFKLGRDYYYSGEYEKAFEYIKIAADNKHHDAQLYLALMYLYGNGCTKDISLAKKYCSLAKEGENQSAYKLWSEIVTESSKAMTKDGNV